ncbi:MAG: two-component regulator propeller domain-containing protein [Flavobacteriales bacterium]
MCSVRALGAAVAAMAAVTLPCLAQQFGFRQFTPREGLAQSQVRAIAQDAQGYLWFGTLGGASRFDGNGFTNYALQEGLPDAQVNAVLAASDGTLWLASGPALVAVRGEERRTVALAGLAPEQRVQALAEGPDGDLFMATDGHGVLRLHHGVAAPLEGYPDTVASARALLVARDGSVLVGVRDGLLRWRDGHCERVAGLPPQTSVGALAQGDDGTIWVGTFGDGLIGIAPNGPVLHYDEENGLLQRNIRGLLMDQRGRLWVTTKFGLNVLEKGRIRAFTVHQGMPNDNVWCAFEDRDGGLWFGTDGAGVLRFAGDRFVTRTVSDGLCSDLIMTLVSDTHGDVWLGTYGNGICRQDGMAMITTSDGLLNNTVWCSLADPDGSLWFGTSDGLCRIVNGVVTHRDSAHALLGQRVLALHRSTDGRLWCGTREGVTIIGRDGTIEHLEQAGDTPLRGIRAFLESDEGLWMAGDQGLVCWKNGQARSFNTANGLSDNIIFCLQGDARGRVWAGTANGLSCVDRGRVKALRLGQDFGSNYVGLLMMDGQGTLWVGTNNGLFRAAPDSLLADPDGAEHITMDDGLRGMECNLNAGFRDQRDRLFFGTNGGLVMYDPAKAMLYKAPRPPVVYITGLRSFLQDTDWKGVSDGRDPVTGLPLDLRLVYRKNHLTFDYTAIALADGDRVRFQYRLIGFDADWLPPTAARFASYSNLPHGEYTFEVRASDRAGHWGTPATFTLHITPPYWLRWWFYALCALGLVLATWAVMRYRHVRRERREKTRQLMLRSRMLQLEQQALNANMNRHFIFNALNSIQYYINRQDRMAANRYLTSFAKLIRKNLDASQTDTTTLAEELSRLELYLLLEHMRFKDKFRYTIDVDPAVDTQAIDIPAMMLQPYVENSIWHGILPMDHQGEVRITVEPCAGGRTQVGIIDDGIGIERSLALKNGAESDHISRGIEITKGRADVLRKLELADIRITGPEQVIADGIARGTRVLIELPSKDSTAKVAGDLHPANPSYTFERS